MQSQVQLQSERSVSKQNRCCCFCSQRFLKVIAAITIVAAVSLFSIYDFNSGVYSACFDKTKFLVGTGGICCGYTVLILSLHALSLLSYSFSRMSVITRSINSVFKQICCTTPILILLALLSWTMSVVSLVVMTSSCFTSTQDKDSKIINLGACYGAISMFIMFLLMIIQIFELCITKPKLKPKPKPT